MAKKGAGFSIEVKPPFRDVIGRFAFATDKLLKDYRVMVQGVGREYTIVAKREAPLGKTGKFRDSISYRTSIRGQNIKLEILYLQPLGSYITKGTRKHPIVGNPLLVFYWAKGPRGAGIYYFRSVMHPGTKPNPFNERAWKKIRPKTRVNLGRIARDWIVRVQ